MRLLPRRRGPLDQTWLAGWVGIVGVGGLIVGVAAAAHSPSQNANGTVLVAGLIVAGMGLLGVFGCFIAAVLRWREDQQTPFEVFHNPQCPDCIEKLQRSQLGGYQVRLHVTNTSRTGVQRVRALLRVLEPVESNVRDYFLRVQHDNELDLSRHGEYLTVEQTVHFDIARVNVPDPDNEEDRGVPGAYVFRFTYADGAITRMSRTSLYTDCTDKLPDLRTRKLPAEWKLKIEVSGWTDFRDVEPVTRTYDLVVDESGKPSLRPLDDVSQYRRLDTPLDAGVTLPGTYLLTGVPPAHF
jgi:hypothetical protein